MEEERAETNQPISATILLSASQRKAIPMPRPFFVTGVMPDGSAAECPAWWADSREEVLEVMAEYGIVFWWVRIIEI